MHLIRTSLNITLAALCGGVMVISLSKRLLSPIRRHLSSARSGQGVPRSVAPAPCPSRGRVPRAGPASRSHIPVTRVHACSISTKTSQKQRLGRSRKAKPLACKQSAAAVIPQRFGTDKDKQLNVNQSLSVPNLWGITAAEDCRSPKASPKRGRTTRE